MWYLFAALAAFGHVTLCVWVINRLHSRAFHYWLVKFLDVVGYGLLAGLPTVVAAWFYLKSESGSTGWSTIQSWLIAYGTVCGPLGLLAIAHWYRSVRLRPVTPRLLSNHTRQYDIGRQQGRRLAGSLPSRVTALLPGNEIFRLSIHQKTIRLPRLPRALDGLTVAHLSDFHLTGQLAEAFFEEVIDQANELDSDIVAITGDIIDKPKCLAWLPRIFERLKHRHGAFFVLGNHDLRVRDEEAVRRVLQECGLFDLGGRSKIVLVNDYPIFMAGNELPWFRRVTDMSECPVDAGEQAPFRVLLSHSPDQIAWARRNAIDLMLAGHTHGGQIRLPWIGPIFSPSRYGVKYASGIYFEEPTLMHVSRGISGTRLVRFNCPPELTQLVLGCDASA
jgi:predicted MPP superfamily phosphohydrolase